MEHTLDSIWSLQRGRHAASTAAHAPSRRHIKPKRGTMVAFKSGTSAALAGIPACITDVWPRLASGDYLVTLEYAHAVKFHTTLITHIEAFWSDVEPVAVAAPQTWPDQSSRPAAPQGSTLPSAAARTRAQ